MKEDDTFFDLDHILKVLNTFFDNVEPYWGYEERVVFVKKVYKFNNYLLEDDETIIETAKLLLHGENSSESSTKKT
jgi:hypothetical protein